MADTRPQVRAGAKRRRPCEACAVGNAVLVRPKTGKKICKACFYREFEDEIHQTIVANELFQRGERVAIAASGGKDSTVLAHTMTLLNERHDYGLDLFLLSVDEGITGYRDDSLETVKRNQQQYSVPLVVVSYKDLYGWTMDDIVAAIGLNSNCTFCGVFRRQALDRGAALCHADKVVTGHNADDVAETVLMNILRGDIARLGRCTSIVTGAGGFMPRSKPFKYVYEKEIVMYAYFNKLDYFSTECIYSPNAYRGYAREFLKDLEAVRATSILDIIHAAEHMAVRTDPAATVTKQTFHACAKCGYMSSQPVCQACVLLNGLNTGKAKLALNDSSARSKLVQQVAQEAQAKAAATGDAAPASGSAAGCGCQSAASQDAPARDGCCGGGGGTCASEASPSAGAQCCSQQPADDASKRVAVLIRRAGHVQDVLLPSSAQWDAMDGDDVLAPEEGGGVEGGAHARPIIAGVATSVHDW